jgi:hypothetical protein
MAEAEAKAVASAAALRESLVSPPLQPPSSLLRRAVAAATAVVERAVALLSPLQKPSTDRGGEGSSPALEAVTVVPPPSLQVAATPVVAPAVAVPQALEVSAGLQTVPLTVLVTAAPADCDAGVPSSVPGSSTGESGENDGWNEGSAPLNPLDVAATKRNLSDLFTAVAVTVPLLPVTRVAAALPAATTRPFQRRRSSMGVSPGAQALKMRRTSTDGVNKGR